MFPKISLNDKLKTISNLALWLYVQQLVAIKTLAVGNKSVFFYVFIDFLLGSRIHFQKPTLQATDSWKTCRNFSGDMHHYQ